MYVCINYKSKLKILMYYIKKLISIKDSYTQFEINVF